ncbi:MAG: regulatory iron-sulfur-containing complex subunit RicT [Anaerolineaceae bacterium]|jgi:cell fate regulator YaaT (PSP1 superfamily)|nr:regulatory iron-sulfur-containing complex subunit RicT [Anaerolineaceae bacterium]
MDNKPQRNVVSVRFSKVGKLYHFEADTDMNINPGDQVVVETARGWQLGEVAQIIGDVKTAGEGSWKKIDRKASEGDLQQRKNNEEKEAELIEFCRSEIRAQNLNGVKAVSAEYSLDGSKISVLYSYEGDDKVELRNLKQEINKFVHHAQVELRQIGPRDVAKIFGGMGACGLPTRCCSKFLTDFSSISIRMAKEQGISLTPTEITGMCGRLRCCLIYEYEMYVENRKQLPKRNKRVLTPVGEGKVIDVLPLKMAVVVDIPEVGRKEFFNSDIQIVDGSQPIQVKPIVKTDIIEEVVDDKKNTTAKDESGQSTNVKNSNKKQQTGKGRRPRWRKRRSSNQNKNNDRT